MVQESGLVPAIVNKCYNTLGFPSEYVNMNLRLRSKSRSDRLLQLTRFVGGANLDHKYRFQ